MNQRDGTERATVVRGAYARMPDAAEDRAVLLQRLELLAGEARTESVGERDKEAVVLVRLGEKERYAVPYRFLVEVIQRPKLTAVPCTPPHIAGVVVHQGTLLTVLDTKQFIRVAPEHYEPDAGLLVVESAGVMIGLLVDEVVGHADIEPESLAPPVPSERIANLAHVQGIHGGDITVLDVQSLVGDAGLVVDQRVR